MSVSPEVHLAEYMLNAYVLGKLDDISAASVQSHLQSCPACRRRLAQPSPDRPLDARAAPGVSAPDWSQLGPLPIDRRPFGPALVPVPAESLPPGLIDHPDYEIIGELGRGGMGVVYLAQNKLMGRREVFKVVSRDLMNSRGALDRFLREMRNAGSLLHANIVTAYSAIRVDDTIVFAMEYVEGYDLAKLVKAQGQLPVRHACNFIQQTALGLQFAHEKGMVHRDIKPGNLMLARHVDRPMVKILDFGLAKATREVPLDGRLTQEGQMLGTPDYIAPEQSVDAHKADIRADIYSLGCTLYYLLTAGPPFHGSSLYAILQAHHSVDAKPLNLIRADVSCELAEIVRKMMAKSPEDRFQEPKEVARALKPFFNYGSTVVKPSIADSSHTQTASVNRPAGVISSVQAQLDTHGVAEAASAPPVERTSGPRSNNKTDSEITSDQQTERSSLALSLKSWRSISSPYAIGGVLILGMIVVAFAFKSQNGLVVLQGLPSGAEVFVDGDRVTANQIAAGQPVEVTVHPGKRIVEVKKDGFRTFRRELIMESGGRYSLPIRLVSFTHDVERRPINFPAGGDAKAKNVVDLRRPDPPAASPSEGKLTSFQVPRQPSDEPVPQSGNARGEFGEIEKRDLGRGPPEPTSGPIQQLIASGDTARGGATWAYTTKRPDARWAEADFDDSAWRHGRGLFGTSDRRGTRVATAWTTELIWLRLKFDMPMFTANDRVALRLFHDEDVNVYVNGHRFYQAKGSFRQHRDILVDPSQKSLLRPGETNVIAVTCRNTNGPQGIDLGLTLQKVAVSAQPRTVPLRRRKGP
jgi:serine/threonine protein kinase